MVNEQIGTENMKRRVDLEHKRQRVMSKITRAMWDDYSECQRMGYDWTSRRAKWEARLTELQSLRGAKNVPRLDPNETPKALGWGPHHWKGTVTDEKLPNDELYAQALARLNNLEEAALPSSSEGQAQPEISDKPAMMDWFKVLQPGLLCTVCVTILSSLDSIVRKQVKFRAANVVGASLSLARISPAVLMCLVPYTQLSLSI